jgi:hypothetical protein
MTAKGITVQEFWNRRIYVTGNYAFDTGENVENYFKVFGTFGSTNLSTLKSYKVHVCEENDAISIVEMFDDKKISNCLRMNTEMPIHYPEDKEGKERSENAGSFRLLLSSYEKCF